MTDHDPTGAQYATGSGSAPPPGSRPASADSPRSDLGAPAPSDETPTTRAVLDVAGFNPDASRPPVARVRPWLAAVTAIALTAAFCVVLGFTVAVRTGERPRQAPPGQPVTHQTVTAEVVSWQASRTGLPENAEREPTVADEGGIWVRAELQVSIDLEGPGEHNCTFLLVLTDGSYFDSEFPPGSSTEVPSYCDDTIRTEGGGRVVVHYLIPLNKIDHVAGVTFSHTMMLRHPLLMSPPETP